MSLGKINFNDPKKYRALIPEMLNAASFVSFVTRQVSLDPRAKKFLDRLKDVAGVKREEVFTWPGTELLCDEPAILYLVDFNEDCSNVILNYTSSWGDWIEPFFEDPAFYRIDHSLILGTVIHEHDVWIE